MLQHEEKLLGLKRNLEGAKDEIDFKPEETVVVLQREYAITHESSNKPILGTSGAGPCLILAIYDNKNKIALLAHIDVGTRVESLTAAICHFSPKDSVAHLYGSHDNENGLEICHDVVQLLEKNKIPIVNADILRDYILHEETLEAPPPASLAIEARTGTIYSSVGLKDLDFNCEAQARNDRFNDEIPVNEEKDLVAAKKFIDESPHLWHSDELIARHTKRFMQHPIVEIHNDAPGIKKYLTNCFSFWNQQSSYQKIPDHPTDPDADDTKDHNCCIMM